MVRRNALIGLPVFLAVGGQRLGEVRDLALAPAATTVAGVVLTGGWWRQRRILDRRGITSWGPDAIIASHEDYLPADAAGPSLDSLIGKPLLSGGGRELGRLDDLSFDPGTGAFTAYQLSAGLVTDLLQGKQLLAAAAPLVPGEAVIWLGDGGRVDQAGGAGVELP